MRLHFIMICWIALSLLNVFKTYAAGHTMTEDGAWCWFQDPRAVFIKGKRTRTYTQWVTRDGQLQIGAYDHSTGKTETHTLKEQWGSDDHNVGAFIILPDKRLYIFYAQHNGKCIYCRTSSNPEDISSWENEVTICDSGRISYAHPLYLSDEKKFYVFWRGTSWKPTFSTSSDGIIWSDPQILIQDDERSATTIRPYTKIVSDGKSSIYFAFTDGHPHNETRNSLYYLQYKRGHFFQADGCVVGKMDALPIAHNKSEKIYDGASKGRAWVWDISLDDQGLPVIAYTRLADANDHRYCYARWTGEAWLDTEVTAGGRWFPQTPDGEKERELYYSGGMALDHSNPSTLYLSRQSDGVFEIEQWHTLDKGKTWQSQPVTRNSKYLNVRPVVPQGYTGGKPLVLWMFGGYKHYKKFKTGIKIIGDLE